MTPTLPRDGVSGLAGAVHLVALTAAIVPASSSLSPGGDIAFDVQGPWPDGYTNLDAVLDGTTVLPEISAPTFTAPRLARVSVQLPATLPPGSHSIIVRDPGASVAASGVQHIPSAPVLTFTSVPGSAALTVGGIYPSANQVTFSYTGFPSSEAVKIGYLQNGALQVLTTSTTGASGSGQFQFNLSQLPASVSASTVEIFDETSDVLATATVSHAAPTKPDLIATTPDGRMFYYTTNGSAAPYAAPQVLGGGWQNFAQIVAGDFSGDGRTDVVGATGDGWVFFYTDNGTSTHYANPRVIPNGALPLNPQLTYADINGDGLADSVATTTSGALKLSLTGIRLPDGASNQSPATGWQNFNHILAGDLNGDGLADLLATTSDGRLFYYPNSGSSANRFPTAIVVGAGGWQNFNHLALSDANGDGLADIVATTADGRLFYYPSHHVVGQTTTAPWAVAPSVIGASGWQNFNRIL